MTTAVAHDQVASLVAVSLAGLGRVGRCSRVVERAVTVALLAAVGLAAARAGVRVRVLRDAARTAPTCSPHQWPVDQRRRERGRPSFGGLRL